MYATFQNRLRIEQTPYKSPRVIYQHGRRLNLNIYIDYTPQNGTKSGPDWQISMEGDKATIREMMSGITREIQGYFRQRTHKDFTQLNFVHILDMAEMASIE